MGQAGNRTDSNLIASNIKGGVSIFGILGSYVGTPPVVGGIVPGYQLTRNIFYNGSTVTPFEDPWTYMYDDGLRIIYLYFVRNDNSNDWTTIRTLILTKSNFNLFYGNTQNISFNSSGGTPIGVQATHIKSVTHNGSGSIKIIWGSGNTNADGEVTYSVGAGTWGLYSYTRNSNNKVAHATAVSVNGNVTISGNTYLLNVFYGYETNVNIIDPYLQTL